jgi:hypothetical protein
VLVPREVIYVAWLPVNSFRRFMLLTDFNVPCPTKNKYKARVRNDEGMYWVIDAQIRIYPEAAVSPAAIAVARDPKIS